MLWLQDRRPAEVDHPGWCDLPSCTAANTGGGHHFSRAVGVPAILPNPLWMTVNLAQGTPVDGFPMSGRALVHLILNDDEGELCGVVMYKEMARDLGRILMQTAGLCEGHPLR